MNACRACADARVAAALRDGWSNRRIAAEYRLSEAGVRRHRAHREPPSGATVAADPTRAPDHRPGLVLWEPDKDRDPELAAQDEIIAAVYGSMRDRSIDPYEQIKVRFAARGWPPLDSLSLDGRIRRYWAARDRREAAREGPQFAGKVEVIRTPESEDADPVDGSPRATDAYRRQLLRCLVDDLRGWAEPAVLHRRLNAALDRNGCAQIGRRTFQEDLARCRDGAPEEDSEASRIAGVLANRLVPEGRGRGGQAW